MDEKKRPLVYSEKRTFGEKASDILTKYMGSWIFIIILTLLFVGWISLNSYYIPLILSGKPYDPFPFILLNLTLSFLAGIQAPIILMSQNRQTTRDRLRSEYDYAVNRKAEREIPA
jgi:uncharacterized membrane protein